MLPMRLLAGLGALVCAAGMTVAASGPAAAAAHGTTAGHGTAAVGQAAAGHGMAAAHATVTARRTAAGPSVRAASSSTATPGGAPAAGAKVLPPHVFAPYYSNGSDTLAATSRASGAKYLTLAFLQTAEPGSCTVVWNGDPNTPVGKTYAAGIAAVQKAGGNVVPSFGGAYADSVDEEIADSCHSVSKIAAQYEKVITTYHVTRLDLDTEEDSLNNYAGINRRNEAIAMVERWAARTHRTVQFVYTIPTNTTGIDQGGSVVLANAVANHAKIAIVDIMTFDYYDNLPHEMADNTEGAAQQLFDRLHELYPGKSASQLWGMIGICEDLGVDDYGPAETLTVADAHTVERWAAARGLAELSFWNIQDDNTAGSHVKQAPYAYAHAFEPFTSWTPVRGGSVAPGAGPGYGPDHQSGNFRSVSCPTASFCIAVDESGNNALRWNGTSWSRPVTIDPGGFKVELTSVSCASTSFCAAVDTLGRALIWNGRWWSGPTAIDPRGAGMESVSCPTASFCVAVDGNGNALTWNGRSWSRPVRIDDTGTNIQSVSCASASFCAAGDWGGYVLTFNGKTWSKPQLVDPTNTAETTGGGIGSMACPTSTFCVGLDWEGGSVTYNGHAWTRDTTFDPDGAEGLMEVSCTSAAFCMAVDGGNDLIWNGSAWTALNSIDVTGDGIEDVSCGSTTSCMVVDWDGNALHWNGTSWPATAVFCPDTTTDSAGDCTTTGSYADARTGVLDAVSCPAASFCAAVDGNGNALTADRSRFGLAWSRPQNIDPIAGILSSVSCPSVTFCMAVDTNGYALSWDGKAWSQPTWSATSPVDRTGGALSSVSCPDSTSCTAVDGNGRVLTWDGAAWSAPRSIDQDGGGLTGVSCPTTSFCAAVDADGAALTGHGSSWSAPRPVDPRGGGLTGVSCSSASFCVAVDSAGRVLTWDGRGWSAPRPVDPRGGGLTGVSCSSASFCMAVDSAGRVLTWDGRDWSAPRPVDPRGGGLTAVSCLARGYCVVTDFDGQTVSVRGAVPR
jgi:phage-related protein